MSKKKNKTRRDYLLDSIKHSERKAPMPRPAVFRDKTKYNRAAMKHNDRRLDTGGYYFFTDLT